MLQANFFRSSRLQCIVQTRIPTYALLLTLRYCTFVQILRHSNTKKDIMQAEQLVQTTCNRAN